MVELIEPKNFKFNHEIGDGGSAVVYKESYKGKFVAVKKFDGTCRMASTASFKREADLLSKINHNNIVKLIGYCTERNNTYLVSEFMAGGSLHDFLQDDTIEITWKICFGLISDIVNGMLYLHEKNILHLDLKSPNILLDEDRMCAKITDFGLAKISTITSTTTAKALNKANGTIRWMPPEVSKGLDSSKKSDIWSFGCILMEFATKNVPFKNLAENAVFLLLQNDKAEIPVNLDAANVPVVVAKMMLRSLNRKVEERCEFLEIQLMLEQTKSRDLDTTIAKLQDEKKAAKIATISDLESILVELNLFKPISSKECVMRREPEKLRDEFEVNSVKSKDADRKETERLFEQKLREKEKRLNDLRENEKRLDQVRIQELERRVKELEIKNERESSASPNYIIPSGAYNYSMPLTPSSNRASPIVIPTVVRSTGIGSNAYSPPTPSNRSSYGATSMGSRTNIPTLGAGVRDTGTTYVSRGSANGRTIYEGPKGGQFYYTSGGNKKYVT